MFKITLRAARELSGYTIEEAAGYFGIKVEALERYEMNTALIPVKIISKISLLYKIPLELIFIGTENKFLNNNKKTSIKKTRRSKGGQKLKK